MDRLRQLWSHISAQLSVLTVSQRLAIGLCAALAAGSILWLLKWSTTPELVPLATTEFTFDQLDTAEKELGGLYHERRGMRLYVRPVDKHNALRLVHQADALPEGSLFDMEAVVSDSNPFQSPLARIYAQNFAMGNELSKIIASSPAVKSASVIINPVTKRRLGGTTDVPTASVTVMLASGRDMTHEMVEGFAKLVAGAVAGLKPHNVYITDARTLKPYSLPHPDDAASFDALAMIKRREEHYRSKIIDKFRDIPGIQVAISVELDMSKRVVQSVKHDLPQPRQETTDSSDQSSSARPAEPGVQANIGTALTGGGRGRSQTTEKTTVENFEPKLSRTETVEHFPFATTKVTAAVGIPRSYVLGVYRANNPDSAENPKDDDPAFVKTRNVQMARVRASVEKIVMAKDPKDVEVDVYPDMDWTAGGGVWSRAPGGVVLAQGGAESFDIMGLVQTYAPQAGLAGLALISLVMMMRVVRKSSEAVVPHRRRTPDSPPEDEPMLTVSETPVGQAETSESMLVGKEVDPATLRYQELGQEVSALVQGDPAGSADLIRSWLEEGR